MKNPHWITVSYTYQKEREVPAIRLSGNWLAQNGFGVGEKVEVTVQPGSLVLNVGEGMERGEG